MPFIEGTASKFANVVITAPETIDTGDGIQTSFGPYTILNPPAFKDSLTIDYTVGATGYQATSDTSGNITGTHISSGSFDGTDISLTFSTAPDDTTDITLSQYTAKGFLQQLKEFVTNQDEATNRMHTEVGDTGDGIQTSFSGTLANPPVAKGQARLCFTIAGVKYFVYDDGQGAWDHPLISSSSLTYASGAWSITFATAPDDTKGIVFFYTDSASRS